MVCTRLGPLLGVIKFPGNGRGLKVVDTGTRSGFPDGI